MSTDFRALCAELLRIWDKMPLPAYQSDWASVIARARAALAEPADGPAVPEGRGPAAVAEQPRPAPPPDGEVAELVAQLRSRHYGPAALDRAAELVERHAAPVPVSERLPGPEDCTAQGWCWVFYRGFAAWTLEPPLGQDGKHTGYTHWLPAHALPLPAPQGGEVE